MGNTKINWATKVWNPVTGCTEISEGCQNCYAERMSKRFAGTWGYSEEDYFKVRLHPERLEEPFHWKKPSRIFVCSMSDLFHEDVPDEFIIKVFNTMANAQWFKGHKFMVLTKRPERMKKIIDGIKADLEEQSKPIINGDGTKTIRMTFAFPLQNIWLGVTAENQKRADERIPILLQIPAAVRFVSVEPMLGPVNLNQIDTAVKSITLDCLTGIPYDWEYAEWQKDDQQEKIDWVICGGESGPGARPMHPDWVRNLRDQCSDANIPFFFKQWGEWGHNLDKYSGPLLGPKKVHWMRKDGSHFEVGNGEYQKDSILVHKIGKKKAGQELDGQIWDQYPR